jgi:hypothetical protein
MEQTAEQVASTQGASMILPEDGRPGGRIWWLQPKCPVGTVAVVMLEVDPQGPLEMASADDQQHVGAENLCTSRDLGVLVDQPTETIVPENPHMSRWSGRRDGP